jgi:hypothetical protein
MKWRNLEPKPAERRPGGLSKHDPNYLDLSDFMHQPGRLPIKREGGPNLAGQTRPASASLST